MKEEGKSYQRVGDPPKNCEPMQKRHEGSQIQGLKFMHFKVVIKQKIKEDAKYIKKKINRIYLCLQAK